MMFQFRNFGSDFGRIVLQTLCVTLLSEKCYASDIDSITRFTIKDFQSLVCYSYDNLTNENSANEKVSNVTMKATEDMKENRTSESWAKSWGGKTHDWRNHVPELTSSPLPPSYYPFSILLLSIAKMLMLMPAIIQQKKLSPMCVCECV